MTAFDTVAEILDLLEQERGKPASAKPGRRQRLASRLLGVDVPRAELAKYAARPRVATSIRNLPASIDWRDVGGRNHVSPVKDQGGCGSCVSFCVCATIESTVSIATGEIVDISEADLHFCSAHGAGCNGWWPADALSEAQRRGVPDEALFPYASAFGADGSPSCRLDPHRDSRLFTPTGQKVLGTMAERKQWLATRGPVCAVFQVYDDFWGYTSDTGVYRHTQGGSGGYHCVEIVGYNDSDRCWIAKNS
ncbi:C1 family peptidase [Kribbella speibonae]|uniref:Peptidase C1A papain C-terminal domain-containing protein n=1 Tax=Kribbella speibonae TaxID=1572660 RepID=A0A4R0IGZ4_9ACTN|nr:C1 family peptidase [Kribbella speibonae]TCC30218.1 hypothetical protein E0H92_40340 [Kribbella speibonae]